MLHLLETAGVDPEVEHVPVNSLTFMADATWRRHDMKTLSTLLALSERQFGDSLHYGPVMQNF